jgi:hypothetical protein
MELLNLMEETGSPLSSFIQDTIEFDSELSVNKNDVFNCYSRWCLKRKMVVGSEQSFKRRFLASAQERNIRSDVDRSNGNRVHRYLGMGLNASAQKYITENLIFEDEGY